MLRPYRAKASVGPGKLVKQFPGRRTSLLALGIPAGRMAIRPYHSGSPFDGIMNVICGTAHEFREVAHLLPHVLWGDANQKSSIKNPKFLTLLNRNDWIVGFRCAQPNLQN